MRGSADDQEGVYTVNEVDASKTQNEDPKQLWEYAQNEVWAAKDAIIKITREEERGTQEGCPRRSPMAMP